MPRKARIDAPGALHHVIVREIERGKIFVSGHGGTYEGLFWFQGSRLGVFGRTDDLA